MGEDNRTRVRWYQFSLRTLLGFVLLVSVGLSWFVTRMRSASRQERAVQALQALGARVAYDYPADADPDLTRPPLRDWLFNVSCVRLDGPGIADAAMEHVRALRRLKELVLINTRITDTGLERLNAVTSLQTLAIGIGHTRITDAGLEHLTGLTNLKSLCLGNVNVTDAGLDHLKGLVNLTSLYLGETRVTDAGLQHLTGLTNLRSLNLVNTNITDAGLEYLKGLTRLRLLYLYHTPITDAGLKHLKGLTSLKTLNLCHTRVTDAGLEHLKGITGLEDLYLDDTRISDAGLQHLKAMRSLKTLSLGKQLSVAAFEDLQKALPKCRINRPNTVVTFSVAPKVEE